MQGSQGVGELDQRLARADVGTDLGEEGETFSGEVAMLERIAVALGRAATADRGVTRFREIRIQFARTAPKRWRNKDFLPPSLHCTMSREP